MRKNSKKNSRINSEVQKELSQIIRSEVKDPRIHPMTSVLRVEVAPDLKSCKAYITVLGDTEARKNTLEGLRRHIWRIKGSSSFSRLFSRRRASSWRFCSLP